MTFQSDSTYVDAAWRRLSELINEATIHSCPERRLELGERIQLAQELLRVAAQQEVLSDERS